MNAHEEQGACAPAQAPIVAGTGGRTHRGLGVHRARLVRPASRRRRLVGRHLEEILTPAHCTPTSRSSRPDFARARVLWRLRAVLGPERDPHGCMTAVLPTALRRRREHAVS